MAFKSYSGGFYFHALGMIRVVMLDLPVLFTVGNVGLLYAFSSYSAWFGLLPLLLPITYVSYEHISEYFHVRKWEKMLVVRDDLFEFLNDRLTIISEDDILIRLRSLNNVTFVVNTYTDDDETAVKSLRQDLIGVVKKSYPRMKVRFMIDRKRESRSSTIV